LERALAIVEASYGKEHLKVAVRLNDLALLYQMARRLKEAETLYERALKICEKQLGEGHPNTETVRKNLEYLRTTE
jgi:hypothetical protein